jgi:hypothetical protein
MSYFTNFPKVDYDIMGNGITQEVTNITSFVNVTPKMLDNISFYSHYVIPDADRPDNVSYNLYGTDKYYWTFFIVNPQLKNSYYDWPQSTASLLNHAEDKYDGLGAVVNGDVFNKFVIGETIVGQVSGAVGMVTGIYPTTEWVQIKPISGTFKSSGESIIGADGQSSVIAVSIKSAIYAPHHFVDSQDELVAKSVYGSKAISLYQWEQENNLEKSKIRIIKPEFIEEVSDRFIAELKTN